MPRRSKELIVLIDGASRGNPGPSGIGVVIQDPRGRVLKEVAEYIGHGTNNAAEYRALLKALEEVKTMEAQAVEIRSDSDLLVSQLTGTYKVKSPELSALYREAMQLLRSFSRWTARHVARGQNAAADALANQAIDQALPESVIEFSVLIQRQTHDFVARVPALPEVEVRAATRSVALERARSAVIDAVTRLRRAGLPIPREERIRIRIGAESID